jgi:ferredoxin-NADP reductase
VPTPLEILATVDMILQYTEMVRSFIVTPKKPVPRFKPGQFFHYALDSYDPRSNWPEPRVSSIANSPTRCRTLEITFAVKGEFTRRMFGEVKEWDQV